MTIPPRWMPAARWLLPLMLTAWSATGHAAGLGQIQLQSWLGQPLQALVPLLGETPDSQASLCVKAKLQSPEGDFVAPLQAALLSEPPPARLRLVSQQALREPALTVVLSIGCGTSVQRTYPILLDPPIAAPVAAAPEPAPAEAAPKARTPAAVPLARPAVAQPRAMPDEVRPARRDEASLQIARQIQKRQKAAPRAVLKLSSPEPEVSFNLKLANALPAAPSALDPQKASEIRAAQAHFAALLRDEDPLRDAEIQSRSARERLQILQAEVELLKERNRLDRAQLEALRNKPDLSFLVALLGVLLLACAALIAWLAWRWKAAQQSHAPKWWETVSPRPVDGPPETAPAPPPAAEPPPEDFVERRLEPRPPGAPRGEQRDGNYPFHAIAPEVAAKVPVEHAKVEEISDVLQEVEFWTLLNDRARVLEILEPLAAEDPPDSPAPWLYLLDTYRALRQHDKYEALRERAMLFFNVNIKHWEDLDSEAPARSLEDFPHLLLQICERWPRPGIVGFLESLLVDDRDGTREGFDLPVYREIMLLIGVAQELQKLPIPPAAAAA